MSNSSLLINQGTQAPVNFDIANGTYTQVIAIGYGTFSNGTINAATVNIGTFQQNMTPITPGTTYGTLGTAGGATWGTLVSAAGAGTKQYVSGITIVGYSGTVDCAITNIGNVGTTGNGVLGRAQLSSGQVLRKVFNPPQVSGTNGTIAFWMGGAGTAFFDVEYWQGV